MSISREARILIGILILAVGAWLWINFFMQGGLDGGFSWFAEESASAPQTVAETTGPPAPAAAETPSVQDEPGDDPGVVAVGPSLAPGLEVDFDDGSPQLAREVSLVELPFLITEPLEQIVEEDPADTVETVRPTPTERITVNPFSPLVLPEPEPVEVVETPTPTTPTPADPTPTPTTPTPTTAETVSPPPEAAPAPPVRAPAPQVLAPPSAPPVRDLPRALPSATLPVTPPVLRTPRSPEDAVVDLSNWNRRAAIRVPDAPAPTVIERDPPALADAARDPEPRGLPETDPADPSAPRVAGLSALSRYLRDNDVSFTGAVMGPVGVGIFRSAERTSPFTVPLGQTLPETDIVLTDLQGQQAELSQNGDREILILESRR